MVVRTGPTAVLALLAATLLLAGCGNETKRELGLIADPPDEFRVVARAPLTVPPNYNLRPPQPGARRPNEASPRDQAQAAILTSGQSRPALAAAPGMSLGETALLQAAGADKADPSVRLLVDRETAQIAEDERSFLDFLIFWRDEDPAGEIVDPIKEAQRLRLNTALGKPVTEGETPKIERRRKAPLEDLF
jgi:hypothetical protein